MTEMYERVESRDWDFRNEGYKTLTHCYHAYPAMMIPQVARHLICEYPPEGRLSMIFDPYMGSGTTLVEASARGINSIGTDINPLAVLISRTKTTHYDEDLVNAEFNRIWEALPAYSPSIVKKREFDDITNSSFWYSEDSLLRLSYITQLVNDVSEDCREFFMVALAETVRAVSYTRNGEFKRYRMEKEKVKSFRPDVFWEFSRRVQRNIEGLVKFNEANRGGRATICSFNTVEGIPKELVPDESIDMVVTSPPYGDSRTTVAYGEFSRWANEWFGLSGAKDLDGRLMGGGSQREPKFESDSIKNELSLIEGMDEKRYLDVISFLNDYYDSINNVSRAVRDGGRICYVVGNRTVRGVQIPLDYFTAEMFERNGFRHETTIVRSIPSKRMPSRNSPTNVSGRTSSTMNNEYMVIMTKK